MEARPDYLPGRSGPACGGPDQLEIHDHGSADGARPSRLPLLSLRGHPLALRLGWRLPDPDRGKTRAAAPQFLQGCFRGVLCRGWEDLKELTHRITNMPTPEEIEEKIQLLKQEKFERENKPPLPSGVIQTIIEKIQELRLESAHYLGNCDRGLVEALSLQLGRKKVSVMDMTGRFPVIILDEEEFPSGAERAMRPDWMKDVVAYFEGAPMAVDLWIVEHQGLKVDITVRFRIRNQRKIKVLAVIGQSEGNERIEGYRWTESEGVLFAVLE